MSESKWLELLPAMLTFDSKPNLEVGDLIVFDWNTVAISKADIEWAKEQRKLGHDVTTPDSPTSVGRTPATYLTITAIRRNAKGKWVAPFTAHGIEDPAFMAPTSGRITDRSRSIDKEHEIIDYRESPEHEREDEARRKRRMMEAQLEGHKRRLKTSTSLITQRILRADIEGLERKLGRDQLSEAA